MVTVEVGRAGQHAASVPLEDLTARLEWLRREGLEGHYGSLEYPAERTAVARPWIAALGTWRKWHCRKNRLGRHRAMLVPFQWPSPGTGGSA